MKKQFLYLIISVVIVIIGVAFYMGIQQKKGEESLLDLIPASKPHQHVSSEGEVVEHTHTHILPPLSKTTVPDTAQTKHPILRIWENLDLAAIRRDYQPYTVPEMMEKWEEKYQNFERPSSDRLARVQAYWPKEKWLQHLMDLGYPLFDASHYKMASDARYQTLLVHKDAYDNPETRVNAIDGFKLSANATWEDVEELNIKFNIVARIKNQRAKEIDPFVTGGVTNLQGVFTPFSPNTVHVHVSKDKHFSRFTGAMLSEEQKNDLTMYGVAPKGVTVVYTDENGNPLPADVVPRFYERQMAALEAAEAHVEQMIADHEALFKALPPPKEKTGTEQVVPSQQQAHPHPHQSDASESTDTGRRPARSNLKERIPAEMLPPDPPSRANIQEWFEVLQELHGGELPKDLRVLQEAINELEAIRQAGKEKMQPPRQRPPERSAPKPPDAPE